MSFCTSCGASVSGAAFCSSCGTAANTALRTAEPSEPQAPNQATKSAAGTSKTNTMSTLGIIFGAIAVLFFPILFGTAGIVLAAIAKSKAEPNANLALVISIGGTVLGFLFGAATADLWY